MKKTIEKTVVLTIIFLSFGSFLFSQEERKLEINVKVHKKKIRVGEPLILNIHVKNISEKTYNITKKESAGLYRPFNKCLILIEKEDGVFKQWKPGFIKKPGLIPGSPLTPERSFHEKQIILYSTLDESFAFSNKGKYNIKISCPIVIDQKEINEKSEAISIDVSAPKKKQNKELFEKLSQENLKQTYGRIVQTSSYKLTSRSVDKNNIEKLFNLTDKYSKSIYTKYLSLFLARYYLMRVAKRREDPETKQALLKKVDILLHKRSEFKNARLKEIKKTLLNVKKSAENKREKGLQERTKDLLEKRKKYNQKDN